MREDDDSINGPGRPRRQEGVRGDRLDADPAHPRRLPRRRAGRVRHLHRVRRPARGRPDRRGEHRRHHPRRLRRRPEVRGPVPGRGRDLQRGALRHRPQEGRHRRSAPSSTTRSRRRTRTARGRRRSTPRSAPAAPRRPSRRRSTATDRRDRHARVARLESSRGLRLRPPRPDPRGVLAGRCSSRSRPESLSLVFGTVLGVMRVCPIPPLRWAGATYVNIVRNTPLTLVFVFCGLRPAPARHPLLVLRLRGHRAHRLHVGVRVRGAAVGHQLGRRR